MFIGLTKLYVGEKLIGDICRIYKNGDYYFFEMHENKGTYKTNKLKDIDILLGSGDKIVIPA